MTVIAVLRGDEGVSWYQPAYVVWLLMDWERSLILQVQSHSWDFVFY